MLKFAMGCISVRDNLRRVVGRGCRNWIETIEESGEMVDFSVRGDVEVV
jgi:hypothetical protein